MPRTRLQNASEELLTAQPFASSLAVPSRPPITLQDLAAQQRVEGSAWEETFKGTWSSPLPGEGTSPTSAARPEPRLWRRQPRTGSGSSAQAGRLLRPRLPALQPGTVNDGPGASWERSPAPQSPERHSPLGGAADPPCAPPHSHTGDSPTQGHQSAHSPSGVGGLHPARHARVAPDPRGVPGSILGRVSVRGESPRLHPLLPQSSSGFCPGSFVPPPRRWAVWSARSPAASGAQSAQSAGHLRAPGRGPSGSSSGACAAPAARASPVRGVRGSAPPPPAPDRGRRSSGATGVRTATSCPPREAAAPSQGSPADPRSRPSQFWSCRGNGTRFTVL